MNIYLIRDKATVGHENLDGMLRKDNYDAFVVVANDEEDGVKYLAEKYHQIWLILGKYVATLIGVADPHIERGLVLYSWSSCG